jgi:hypothetical protein
MPYTYPISDQNEIPHWVLFEAAEYSVLAQDRTRVAISERSYDYIQLPLPLGISISTQHAFSEGPNPVGPLMSAASEANSPGKTPAERAASLMGRLFVDPLKMIMDSYSTIGDQQMFSNITEMSLFSEARRVFTLQYAFVPKSFEESRVVANICEAFRVSSYPSATEVPERILPPPLWRIQVVGLGDTGALTKAWLGDPLVCVLSTVEINKIPFGQNDTARFFQDGGPAATTMTLFFKEFETGTLNDGEVFSKSEISRLVSGEPL